MFLFFFSLGEVLMLVFFGLVFFLEKEDDRDKLKVFIILFV